MFWITRGDSTDSPYSIWEYHPTRYIWEGKTLMECVEDVFGYEPLEIPRELFESLVENVRLAPNHILKVKEFRAVVPTKRRLRRRSVLKKRKKV